MKKFLALMCLLGFALSACATTGLDPRVDQLEAKVSKLERQMVMGMAVGAGSNFYPCRGIDGGAAGDLDKIASPSIGDSAFVVLNEDALYGNALFVYVYTDYGAAVSEALPYEVKPDTGASANYAWSLVYSNASVPVMMTGALALTLGQQNGGVVHANAAGTLTLQGAATIGFGKTLCVYVEDASETVVIESATGSDIFNLHGTPLAAGNVIDSPGNAGDFICVVSTTDADGGGTDGYLTLGYGEEAWVDGGAS